MGIDPEPETILLRFERPESTSKSRPGCLIYAFTKIIRLSI